MHQVDPGIIADKYTSELQSIVQASGHKINVVGFIASDDQPSVAYANATKKTFTSAGFSYDLKQVERLELESAIIEANDNPDIHGIFVYFPVFNNQEDNYLRNLVSYTKDIEAGSLYWTRKMTANDRKAVPDDKDKKALVPCTPLAIVKVLEELSEYHLNDKIVTIFNRSEVIGRPLAVMMSNDGAHVYSFDINGPLQFVGGIPSESTISRASALAKSDIVITGVPSRSFSVITRDELKPESVAVNFSSVPNFAEEVVDHVRVFVPRVGPMTVAMCMRNTFRLFENFHQ